MTSDPLIAASLLGTARLKVLPAAPAAELESTWQAIPMENSAAGVLHALALTRAMRRAGMKSREAGSSAEASPPEELPVMNAAAVDVLIRLLGGEFPEVLPEWLRLASASQRVVPGRALPDLLNAATRNRMLRPVVRVLSGRRGLWIAKRRLAFAWLLEESAVDDDAWETGQAAERLAWLRQTRAGDPVAAAAAISTHWASEEPSFRESILRLVLESPQTCDETWLTEMALKDRRQEIRELAASTLSLLEPSAFRARAIARARTCLKVERRLLKRVIAVEPPAAFDASWAADGLKEKPPQGTGEKAWWLRQIIGQIPLADWPSLLRIDEEDLFSIAIDADWKEAVMLGWIDAARRFSSQAMAARFIPLLAKQDPWPLAAGTSMGSLLSTLLATLPAAARFQMLDEIGGKLPPPLAMDLLATGAEAPPAGTGIKVLALLDQTLSVPQSFLTRPQARALAVCVPFDGIQRRLEMLSRLPALSSAAEEFATVLEFRRTLSTHFNVASSS